MREEIKSEPPNPPDQLAVAAAQKKKQKDYWLNKLSGELEKTTFPYDHKKIKPGVNEPGLDHVKFRVPGELFPKLMKLSNGSDHRLHMILVAALLTLLKKYTGNNDIILGTTIVKQEQGVDESRLINTVLPLRNQLEDRMTFKELLLQVRQTIVEATENQDYPFDTLLRLLNLADSGEKSPIFAIGVLLENIHTKRYFRNIKPNMILSFLRTPGGVEGEVEYNPRLYKKTTNQRIITHLETLLEDVLSNVNLKLSEVNILSSREKKQILFQFNNTKKDIRREQSYSHLFEEQVKKTPDKIAAAHNAHKITYRELNEKANPIAHFLIQQGVKADAIVTIYMNRCMNMLASIIGIFKAGGAYLGLDVNYPEERIKTIIEDSETKVLITEKENIEVINHIMEHLPGLQTILCLGDETDNNGEPGHLPGEYPLKNPGIAISPGNLAYIIYTSGTTGKPKGVMIHQLGLLNHIYANIDFLGITERDVIAQTASLSFDISVWQFLALLIVGGITFIIDSLLILEPLRLIHSLQKGKVTIMETVPSLMSAFLELVKQEGHKELKDLRWMMPTGEALSVSLAREWYKYYPQIKLVNAYGPAEASDDVTLWVIDAAALEFQNTIPIGKPLQNLHLYIMDTNLSLCPVNVPGEICIAGIGIGKGYLKNPEKTAKAFVSNPYLDEINDSDYSILYKTGDMGYFTGEGNIEFLGRQDYQVKLRGFRIELEEIENQLLNIDEVKEAVIIAKEKENGDKYLCVYIVLDTPSTLTPSKLRETLSANLPYYMVPSYFVLLDQLPLTPNRKIDRKALPEPDIKAEDNCMYIAPRNEIEKKLAEIWAEILEIEQDIISIEANFFEIGGHSLKATIMAAKIHKQFNTVVPLREIFRTPTIAEIASLIKVIQWADDKDVSTTNDEEREEVIL